MSQASYPENLDLSNCEKEPIHIIGKSQAHGVIVGCDKKTLKITQIGKNAKSFFGIAYQDLLCSDLSDLVGEKASAFLQEQIESGIQPEVKNIEINNRHFTCIPHISGDTLIVDFEPIEETQDPFKYQSELSRILNILGASEDPDQLCQNVAKITRNIFGYDRVMVYKFDEEWNGEVIAEEKESQLESWLGLHYPSSDIPKQSRDLFLKNRVRTIADVRHEPVAIEPEISPINGEPLDLSNSELRGVSPIHIEYLVNMQVGASLTAALICNGKLWGLLACHHSTAKVINYYQRQTCDFLTQIFSNELSLKETSRYLNKLEEWREIREELVSQIEAKGKIKMGLTNKKVVFTDLLNCDGGAVLLNGKLRLVGKTPSKQQVRDLCNNFLAERKEPVFFTKHLSKFYNPAENFKNKAAGVLSIKLGQNNKDLLVWFRPEISQNVQWGGNPDKSAAYDEEKQRIAPRKSFEKWTEKLTGVSSPWLDYQISAANAIRESLSNIILEKQKLKIDKLNKELIAAHEELKLFSQGLSHDLKAPLRGIDGYAHILKEDYFDQLDNSGQSAIETILSSSGKMRQLIDDILSFAGVSGQSLNKNVFSVNRLLKELFQTINIEANYSKATIHISEDLPSILGDKRMLTQVWSNLVTNALKYSEQEEAPFIEIGYNVKDDKTVYFVRDNGIGFDPKYKEKLFDLFSRFSGGDYEGTGVGLAIVKKIIEKHNGEIWAESEPGKGSTFFFYV